MDKRRVLIADDDQNLAQALKLRCQCMGLTAECAPDGLSALMSIMRTPPHLLILDVNMPADGLTLCQKLTTDQSLPPVPVIILTGKSDEETINRCEELGAHYVMKGSGVWDTLKPLISRLVDMDADNRRPPRPAPAASDALAEPPEPSGPKVLVIDDDPELCRSLKVNLRLSGVKVFRAFNGMQGFWMALKESPGLIICDAAMPEDCGRRVIEHLHDHPMTRGIPVVLLGDGQGEACRTPDGRADAGVVIFHPRSAGVESLLVEIRRHIEGPLGSPA